MAAPEFCNNTVALEKLGPMLNKEECSDTVFLVNNARYYAWSHIVAANSTVLGSLMTNQFAICEDRELHIRNVKHEESFHLVLKYMYGVQINFTDTDFNVICEASCLAEEYKVEDLSLQLKQFISTKIDGFDIAAVVSLLNTSKKFNLAEMYERVKVYAFKNTELLLKHASFIELQYEVLIDLLKSDWFYAKEIEILTSVLTWHDDMDGKKKAVIGYNMDEQDGASESITGEQSLVETSDILAVNNDAQSDIAVARTSGEPANDEQDGASESITGEQSQVETSDILAVNNDTQTDIAVTGTSDESAPDGNGMDNGNLLPNKDGPLANLVQSFKENVLKALLSHIRHLRFSTLEYLKALESDLFAKHKDLLLDLTYFSPSTESRKLYKENVSITSVCSNPSGGAALHNKFFNLDTIKFTIKRLSMNTVYQSAEHLQIGCFKLKMDVKEYSVFKDKHAYLDVCLNCSSDEEGDWECYAEVQVILKPNCDATTLYYGACSKGCQRSSSCKTYRYWKYLPEKQSVGQPTLKCNITSKNCRSPMGEFKLDLTPGNGNNRLVSNNSEYNRFVSNNSIQLHVNILKFEYAK